MQCIALHTAGRMPAICFFPVDGLELGRDWTPESTICIQKMTLYRREHILSFSVLLSVSDEQHLSMGWSWGGRSILHYNHVMHDNATLHHIAVQ